MEKKNVLVCVTGQLSCERLIVAGARFARTSGGQLYVLHVARPDGHVLGYANEAEALEYLFSVSLEHGADMVVIKSSDVVDVLAAQARELGAATLVAGRAANYSGWDMLDELKLRIPEVQIEIQ